MALERYGFFDGSEGDERIYEADPFSAGLRALCGSGVSAIDDTNLVVTAEGGTMRALIGYGLAVLEGYYYELKNDGSGVMAFTHSAAVGADRIDRIILQLDQTTKATHAIKRAGTAAASPEPPAIVRSSSVYELSLAQVRVRAGATEIISTDITDERADESVCGAALPEGVTLSKLWTRMAKPLATITDPGMMSAADKVALDALNLALDPTVTVVGEVTTKKVACNDYELEGAKDYKTTGGKGLLNVDTRLTAAEAGKADLDPNAKLSPAQASSRIVSVAANKTLALTDAGTLQLVSGEYTITVPANADVALPVGTEIEITQYGAAQVTVAAATGVTILSLNASLKTIGRYASICLKKVDTNVWLLQGGLSM